MNYKLRSCISNTRKKRYRGMVEIRISKSLETYDDKFRTEWFQQIQQRIR